MDDLEAKKAKLKQVLKAAKEQGKPHIAEKAKQLILNKKNQVVKNVTDHIDTRQIAKISTASEFKKNIAKKLGKKSLKALPIVGGIISAVSSGEASAAVPILDQAESLGPRKGSLAHRLEMGDRSALLELAKKKRKR